MNNSVDNFDDIDLDELFNDFNEKKPSIPSQRLLNSKKNQDELIELNETDCTAPRVIRKRTKTKKKINAKQMTMYDYASSISYRHKHFYSSLDNTTTTKTIIKGQKRSLTDPQSSSPISKKTKIIDSTPPDFIDKLLKYLDERSHHSTDKKKPKN